MINVHVDVDNLWMYENEFGIKINSDKELIYKKSLPNFLKLLDKHKSKATFFIIGKDLTLPACAAFCKKAVSSGHEIANHTWSHSINFDSLPFSKKKEEIAKTHNELKRITKKNPAGFRGPGYYTDSEILKILNELNYSYDSSILPGFAQVLMTTYAKTKGGMNNHKTFGKHSDILSKTNPYKINKEVYELPISTLPFIKMPIHTTFAYFFGSWYRNRILTYLKSKPKYITYLFHAIDFAEVEAEKNHPVIPLRYSFDQRMDFADKVLKNLVLSNGKGLKTTADSMKSIRH